MDGFFIISYAALWVLLLLVIIVVIGILRHIGIIYQSLTPAGTNLTEGKKLQDTALVLLGGSEVHLARFRGTPTAFALISPGCSACDAYLQLLREGKSVTTSAGQTVIISLGDEEATREMLDKAGGIPAEPVLIDKDGRIRAEWGVTSTPITVVVDKDFRVLQQIVGVMNPGNSSDEANMIAGAQGDEKEVHTRLA